MLIDFISWFKNQKYKKVYRKESPLHVLKRLRLCVLPDIWMCVWDHIWYSHLFKNFPKFFVRSNQSILKEINDEYSLEELMLKLKLQYSGQPTHWKTPWCWERLRAGGEGMHEDEMVGWHHQLNGHEFEQTPGDGEGHGSLACSSPWSQKESDMT